MIPFGSFKKSIRVLSLICFVVFSGCARSAQPIVRAPDAAAPLPTGTRTNQEVRTPIQTPPQQAIPIGSEDEYEEARLESVLPGSSNTFDPFTYGRPGSPYGPGKLFAPGISGARCGPMELPMSPQFADPGDTQATVLIAGNGLECTPDIDHDKPGAAVTFPVVAAIFTNAPWTITNLTATTVTITNGAITLRFTYRITPTVTYISKVEYL